MAAFVPIPCAQWPAIAAGILKPWPSVAIDADMQWWIGQKRPGRQKLAKRWGWSEARARKMIEGFVPLAPDWCNRCGGNGGARHDPCKTCDGTGSVWVRR